MTELPTSTDWKGISYNSVRVDENGILQAGANNDWCTRAGGYNFRRCGLTPQSPRLSDRGSVFTSKLRSSLCYFLGIKERISTAFHPQIDRTPSRKLGVPFLQLLSSECGSYPRARSDIEPAATLLWSRLWLALPSRSIASVASNASSVDVGDKFASRGSSSWLIEYSCRWSDCEGDRGVLCWCAIAKREAGVRMFGLIMADLGWRSHGIGGRGEEEGGKRKGGRGRGE